MAPRIAIVSTAHIHTIDYCKDIARECGAPHVIWDDDEARGRSYAEKFNSRFEPDLGKVLADPAVDGFAVCSENARHTPLLRRVIPVGKPTFCEKPLAVDPAEADEVAVGAGIVLQSGEFFLPGQLRILESGAESRAELKICEGRFHQVKRMMAALGKPVLALRRTAVGGLALDESLSPGEYRLLEEGDIARIFQ